MNRSINVAGSLASTHIDSWCGARPQAGGNVKVREEQQSSSNRSSAGLGTTALARAESGGWIGGSKADVLRALAPLVSLVHVDTGVVFDVEGGADVPLEAARSLVRAGLSGAVIVRSCADGEDSVDSSCAGRYLSVVVPDAGDEAMLAEAIMRVIGSYPPASCRRVFVQSWRHPVDAAAVVTTRVLGSDAPYYVVSLDASSGRTDQVTSGACRAAFTWYLHRGSIARVVRGQLAEPPPGQIRDLVSAAVEVESAARSDRLDLELALDGEGVHLFQARPMAYPTRVSPGTDAAVSAAVDQASRDVEAASAGPALAGGAFFSTMADWNPAEMIGRRPRPLALSLYQWLITRHTWAAQRAEYGYRDLRGVRLMSTIGGQPFVDVRASLCSFVPAGLADPTARNIVETQIDLLRADPALHDRVEFDIAVPDATFTLDERIAALVAGGMDRRSAGPLREAVRAVTREGVVRLAGDRAALTNLPRPGTAPVDDPFVSVRHCLTQARHAALVFAHLARTAFVATDLLRSLTDAGLAREEDVARFMRSVGTVTVTMQRDARRVRAGRLTWQAFVARYGHLRPGTYDVTVRSYGEEPDVYLRPYLFSAGGVAPSRGRAPAPWSARQSGAVAGALAGLDIGLDEGTLVEFCRNAISAREQGKFVYSAWVSCLLDAVIGIGVRLGIDRDDLAYLTVDDIMSARAVNDRGWLTHLIAQRREAAAITDLVELPDCLWTAHQCRYFERPACRPNYVGTGRITGPVRVDPCPADPPRPGDVVAFTAVDPGFDWLFAHRPAGLVTCYGGANSHLAVRCAELGIPAAIGVGAEVYRQITAAVSVTIDAAKQHLGVLA